MALFSFAGPYPMTYPEGKDSQNRNLGLVAPGDIRDLDEPPDRWWRDVTGEDQARLEAEAAERAAAEAEAALRAAEQAAEEAAGDENGEPGGEGSSEPPEPSGDDPPAGA